MTPAEAKALLPEIIQAIDAIGPEWFENYDVNSHSAQLCERDAFDGKIYTLATLSQDIPTEQREFLRKAPTYVRAVLLLRTEAVRAYRSITNPSLPESTEPKPPNYAAEAAMKCAEDGAFKRWLMERTNLLDAGDAERVKTHVRLLLKLTSLGELNTDPEAAERWKKMRADFKAWLRSP